MKKFIKIVLISVLVLALVGFFVFEFMLNSAVKTVVETVGPKMTRSSVKLGSVSLSPFSGSGSITGTVVGNPSGFKTDHSVEVKNIQVHLKLSSLTSDPLVIDSIAIDAPDLVYEIGLSGSNISEIMHNVDEYCGSEKSTRKYVIKDFMMTGGKIQLSASLLQGNAAPLAVPDMHLTGIGEKSNGATLLEVMQEITVPLEKNITSSLSSAKKATDSVKNLFSH